MLPGEGEFGSITLLYPTHDDSISRVPPKYSIQVERNEERHKNFPTAPGVQSSRFLSPNPGEKISNYLNILWIAVSSERGTARPFKPCEMQNDAGRDAAASQN
jgi:hypothetical protein